MILDFFLGSFRDRHSFGHGIRPIETNANYFRSNSRILKGTNKRLNHFFWLLNLIFNNSSFRKRNYGKFFKLILTL
jgi:hypothetical protein